MTVFRMHSGVLAEAGGNAGATPLNWFHVRWQGRRRQDWQKAGIDHACAVKSNNFAASTANSWSRQDFARREGVYERSALGASAPTNCLHDRPSGRGSQGLIHRLHHLLNDLLGIAKDHQGFVQVEKFVA